MKIICHPLIQCFYMQKISHSTRSLSAELMGNLEFRSLSKECRLEEPGIRPSIFIVSGRPSLTPEASADADFLKRLDIGKSFLILLHLPLIDVKIMSFSDRGIAVHQRVLIDLGVVQLHSQTLHFLEFSTTHPQRLKWIT